MPSKRTVLIVDDSEINRKILWNILQKDYRVMQAESGTKALGVLMHYHTIISAVLTDLVMPEMDGFTLLDILCHDERYQNIPVIVTTGEDNDAIEVETLNKGAWDFVSKPYKPEIIRCRLQNVISRSQVSAYKQLQYLSEFDELTGIYNKKKFFEMTERMLLSYPDKPFVMVRMDISRFHLINSFFGMHEGDKLLLYIATRIREFSKQYTPITYGRMEADQFAFCMPSHDENIVREKMVYAKQVFSEYELEFNIVPIFGLYEIEDRTLPIHLMLDMANLAAKQCKDNYIKNYAYYDDKMGKKIECEQNIANEMYEALEQKQFCVYLQPKFDLIHNKIIGAEALLRWKHPKRGMIAPSEFVPVFERNVFIVTVDFFVWESVCQLLRGWLDAGLNPLPISVNVSRVNLYNPHLVSIITNLVEKYHIPTELFHLELTESAYVDNPILIKEMMLELQKKGFVILMDDFGSGYSSLNVLKDIPVDVLKIDMKFFTKTDIPGRAENIIASVIRMAKWLDVPTIAEGVEEGTQVEFLRSVGCEYVQGYFFDRPMPVDEYVSLLHQSSNTSFSFHHNLPQQENMNELWDSRSETQFLFMNLIEPMAIAEWHDNTIEILRANHTFYELFGAETDLLKETNAIEKLTLGNDETVLGMLAKAA